MQHEQLDACDSVSLEEDERVDESYPDDCVDRPHEQFVAHDVTDDAADKASVLATTLRGGILFGLPKPCHLHENNCSTRVSDDRKNALVFHMRRFHRCSQKGASTTKERKQKELPAFGARRLQINDLGEPQKGKHTSHTQEQHCCFRVRFSLSRGGLPRIVAQLDQQVEVLEHLD